MLCNVYCWWNESFTSREVVSLLLPAASQWFRIQGTHRVFDERGIPMRSSAASVTLKRKHHG